MDLVISMTERGCNMQRTIKQGPLNSYELDWAAGYLQKHNSAHIMSFSEKKHFELGKEITFIPTNA